MAEFRSLAGIAILAVMFGTDAPPPAAEENASEQNASQSQNESAILQAGDNEHMRFRLHGLDAPAPEDGFKLLLVLPGGDGSDEFRGFIANVHKNALPPGYLLAQLIAPVWDPNDPNRIVWPTRGLPYPKMKFPTEHFIAAVIDEVAQAHLLDERHIYAMGWSSGGPPVYATAMQEQTRLTGAMIAMSVFHPDQYPPAKHAGDRAFFILHSPQDFIAMRFPEAARDALREAGASVKLQTYEGGHGWRGEAFNSIGHGIKWLEAKAGER